MWRKIAVASLVLAYCRSNNAPSKPKAGTITIASVTPSTIASDGSATISWSSTIAGDFIVNLESTHTVAARNTTAAGAVVTTPVPGSALAAGDNAGEIVIVSSSGVLARASFTLTLSGARASSSGGSSGGGTTGGVTEDPRCVGLDPSTASFMLTGAGTPASPWLLCTAAQVNAVSYASGNWGDAFVLGNDVDLGTVAFLGIGTITSPFNGTFDGQGHTVSNANINQPSQDDTGFFGALIGSSADVERLSLANVSMTGEDQTGGLIGYAQYATILNCATSGTVSGRSNVGGLIGFATSITIVSTSGSTATVTALASAAGGLIGFTNSTEIFNSYATGAVSAGADSAGGLLGNLSYNSEIWNSYATGSVSAVTGFAGGLAGQGESSLVANSFSTGNVTLTGNTFNKGISQAQVFYAGDGQYAQPVINSFYNSAATCTGACQPSFLGEQEQGEAPLSYFESASNAPLNQWDFVSTWAPPAAGALPRPAPQFFDYAGWGDCSSHQSGAFAGGSGTPEAPFLICTAAQLASMQTQTLWQGRAFRLMDNITFTGSSWTAIGTDAALAYMVFDGNGKSIDQFAPTDVSAGNYFGFFGLVSGGVKRLAMTNSQVTSNSHSVGIIGGQVQGMVVDSYVTGAVSGKGAASVVSGITSTTAGGISNCYSTADVSSLHASAAGICIGPDSLLDCFSTGAISGAKNSGPISGFDTYTNTACAQDSGVQYADNDPSYYPLSAACTNCCTPYPTTLSIDTSADATYFYTASNPPLSKWDFVHIWQANGSTYPTLR